MNKKKYRQSITVFLTAICLSWICHGCLTARSHSWPARDLLDMVLSGESLFKDRAGRLSLPEEDIFLITRDMRDFLNTHVPGTSSDYYKLQGLIEAVTDKSLLGWNYDAFNNR